MQNSFSNYLNKQVIKYNNELWFHFIQHCKSNFETLNQYEYKEVLQSFDLLKAVNSYRSYQSIELLFENYPELQEQAEYIELLWGHFDKMNDAELSDLAIQMLHEIF